MKSRLDRIVTGCNFVGNLVNLRKQDSAFFKTAAQRLIKLLQDQINGVDEMEEATIEQIQEIFNPGEESSEKTGTN